MDVPRSTDQTGTTPSKKAEPPKPSSVTPVKKQQNHTAFFTKICTFFKKNKEQNNEIIGLVSAHQHANTPLSNADRALITAALEFSKKTADELSIPRADMVTLQEGDSYTKALEVFTTCEHSRLPIIREDLDDIIGFITLKDLIGVKNPEKSFSLQKIMRPCTFVPGNLSIMKVLEAMKNNKVQLAIVVDEYGGSAGLITLKDITEALLGEVVDEHESTPPKMLHAVGDNTYHIDPRLPIEELEQKLNATLETFDNNGNPQPREFETVGGFILALAGHVPTKGEKFATEAGLFTILEADGRRIKKIKLKRAAA